MPIFSPKDITQYKDSNGNTIGLKNSISQLVHDTLWGTTTNVGLKMKQAVEADIMGTIPSFPEAVPTIAVGTEYFIDSVSGLDTNNGLTPATAWQNVTKLNSLNPGAGAVIYLAADGVWEYADTWTAYKAQTTFPYNGSDNLRGTAAAPINVKPYYPRGSSASKPIIRWYGATQTTDWTQETSVGSPAITVSNVWSTPWTTGTSNGYSIFLAYVNAGVTTLSVGAVQQVNGQAYGTGLNNPGQLLNPGDYAVANNKIYVCAPSNPSTYFGQVRVCGMFGVFSSFWQGLHNVKFNGLQFEYCRAIAMNNESTAPVMGLEVMNCTFKYAQCGIFNNQNSNAAPQQCDVTIRDNTFQYIPYSPIQLNTSGGTTGNTLSWKIYRNSVYHSNLTNSPGGGLLYNQAKGGTYHHAWGNYGYDIRNGTGGNNIDGAFLYADINSQNTVFFGNIVEQSGIGVQLNLSVNGYVVSNLFIDCIAGVRVTGATGSGSFANLNATVANNTWLWTGRVTSTTIPIGPGTGGYGQPVFQEWNDMFTTYATKMVAYALVNNLAVDSSGVFTGTKKFASFISTQITTSLIAGNASAGLGLASIVTDNGTDVTANANVMSLIGTVTDSLKWLASPTTGEVKLNLDSPLWNIGMPLSTQFYDIKGDLVNGYPTPGCYERPAPTITPNLIPVSSPSGNSYRATANVNDQFLFQDTSKTFGVPINGQSDNGLTVFNGAIGQTFTLPTISNTNILNTMVGMRWTFQNASAFALTVATQGSQTYNNRTGVTSMILGPGQRASFEAAVTSAGTLFWTVATTAGSVSGTGTLPWTLLSSATPMILVSSGTMAANGAITLTTALPVIYTTGCYIYLPAGAIATSSVAGWYWAIFSSTTVGVVYNNVYTTGVPLPPTSTTAFVTTGPGAYTQSTAQIPAMQMTVPGGSIGPNGQLDWASVFTNNSDANSKTFFFRLGTTTFWSANDSTGNWYTAKGTIANRNAENVNINMATWFTGGVSGTTEGQVYGAVDTSANQIAEIIVQLAVATDYIQIEAMRLTVIPSN